MKKRFSCVFWIALCAGLLLAGCDKLKNQGEANAKANEDKANAQAEKMVGNKLPDQKQTHYGKAMEKGRDTECRNNLRNLGQMMIANDGDLHGGSASCPAGGDYEFLVNGRVRSNSGTVKVLRCPNHNFVLYSDGHVE